MSDLPTLYNFLGSWLRMASNRASTDLARKLAPKGSTVAEWEVLWTIYDEPTMKPTSPSELAEDLSIDRAAITRLAARLAQKGLLRRRARRGDKRGRNLTLTPKGSALARELLEIVNQEEAELQGKLGAKSYATLKQHLDGFVKAHKS